MKIKSKPLIFCPIIFRCSSVVDPYSKFFTTFKNSCSNLSSPNSHSLRKNVCPSSILYVRRITFPSKGFKAPLWYFQKRSFCSEFLVSWLDSIIFFVLIYSSEEPKLGTVSMSKNRSIIISSLLYLIVERFLVTFLCYRVDFFLVLEFFLLLD